MSNGEENTSDVDMSDGHFRETREEDDVSIFSEAVDETSVEVSNQAPAGPVVPATQTLPITARFSEQQSSADTEMLQGLINAYTAQYETVAFYNADAAAAQSTSLVIPPSDAPTNGANPQITSSLRDSSFPPVQGVMASMHSPVAFPQASQSRPAPTTSMNSNTGGVGSTHHLHSPSRDLTAASEPQIRTMQADINTQTATSTDGQTSEPSNAERNPNVSSTSPQHFGTRAADDRSGSSGVTYSDLQLLIRGIDGLSTEVRECKEILNTQSSTIGVQAGRPGQRNNSRPDADVPMHASSDLDDDADDEDDGDSRRKSVNSSRLHSAIRIRLNELHLRVDKDLQQLALKESPSIQTIADYSAGRHEGPNLDDLRVDWTSTLRSHWNSAAIHLLTVETLNRVRSDYYSPRSPIVFEDWMTSEKVHAIIRAKLDLSRKVFLDALPPDPRTNVTAEDKAAMLKEKKERQMCKNRRRMRQKSLYETRMKIVKERLGTDPAWEGVLKVMKVIGYQAMSEDETDVERSTESMKVVRRVDTPWASPALKVMINTIDLYYSRFTLGGNEKAGQNRRDRLTTMVSTSRKAIPKALPRNSYNEYFLNNLNSNPYRLESLKIKRDIPIPVLPLPPSHH